MDGLAENDLISSTGIETTVAEFGDSFANVACADAAAINQNFDPCMIQASVREHYVTYAVISISQYNFKILRDLLEVKFSEIRILFCYKNIVFK